MHRSRAAAPITRPEALSLYPSLPNVKTGPMALASQPSPGRVADGVAPEDRLGFGRADNSESLPASIGEGGKSQEPAALTVTVTS